MGHLVRSFAVMDALATLVPLRLHVVSASDPSLAPPSLRALVAEWRREAVDVGVVQSDDVTVDREATARRLDSWLGSFGEVVAREAAHLQREGADLVVGDVPAAAFEAAKASGIRSVAVANFSWDWIYGELGFPTAARRSAEAYACADLLLQATPFAPMPAFPHRRAVGLLARSPSSSGARARASLGLAPEERSCLVAFQPASAPSLALPPARAGRRFLVPSGWAGHRERGDVVRLPADLPFADAIAAADVVLGKPGYGLIGDLEVAGARFLYAPRPGFPENAVLEAHLSARAGTRAIAPARLASGDWEAELEALESAPRPAAMEAGGCLRAARAILDLLAVDRRGESA